MAGDLKEKNSAVYERSGDPIGRDSHWILREKLDALGKFARHLAHEIKNPLFAISSGLQLILDSDELNDEDREMLELLYQEAMRISRILQKPVHYAHRPDLFYSRFLARHLFEDLRSMHEESLKENEISFLLECPDPEISLKSDRDRLTMAIVNLLQNAIEASPKGSRIALSVDRDASPDRIRFRLSDEGPGLPPEDPQQVFELFYGDKKGGAGLGLSFAQAMIHEVGGRLWAANRDDRSGAEFHIELPNEEADER